MDDLVDLYLGEIKEMFQFDEHTAFSVYVFEKDNLNRVPDKNITKDGIHMVIGIQMDHKAQLILRKRVMDKMNDIWQDCPIVNTWNDVFDEGISKGYTNWQLYGSCKPNHEAYKVTSKYNISYDNQDGEIINEQISIDAKELTKRKCSKNFRFEIKSIHNISINHRFSINWNRLTSNQPQRKHSPVTTIFDDESGSKDITKNKNQRAIAKLFGYVSGFDSTIGIYFARIVRIYNCFTRKLLWFRFLYKMDTSWMGIKK